MELFRFGFHVLHDQGLAEEMVQETFIKFCQRAGSYDACAAAHMLGRLLAPHTLLM
jgi:hypothetical protein